MKIQAGVEPKVNQVQALAYCSAKNSSRNMVVKYGLRAKREKEALSILRYDKNLPFFHTTGLCIAPILLLRLSLNLNINLLNEPEKNRMNLLKVKYILLI